ncbi:hypothetical protein [Lacinutrix salivirga]
MKKLLSIVSLSFLLVTLSCNDEPLEGDFVTENPTNCAETTQALATAALDFINVSDENYTTLCNAYKVALQNQIAACGDEDNSLQTILESLGNCNDDTEPDACETAENASSVAEDAFDNATQDNYNALCAAFKMALENEITECGDADGSLQAMIDNLGDCTFTAPNVEISLSAGTLPIEFDLVNVVTVGTTLQVTGETSAQNNYSIYFEVEEGATGMEIINSTFVLTLSTTDPDYFPSTQGFDDFTSTITENGAGTLVGSFGGIVTNTSGGDLSLTQGTINIMY